MWRWVLVLVAIAWGKDDKRTEKLVACLSLSRHTILAKTEELSNIVADSPFEQEDILTKIMTSMAAKCMNTLPDDAIAQILSSKEESPSFSKLSSHVPIPKAPFKTEKQIQLTAEESAIYQEILMIQKRVGASDDYRESEPSVPFIGTKGGMTLIIGFFAVFAGLIIYILKNMQESEEKPDSKAD